MTTTLRRARPVAAIALAAALALPGVAVAAADPATSTASPTGTASPTTDPSTGPTGGPTDPATGTASPTTGPTDPATGTASPSTAPTTQAPSGSPTTAPPTSAPATRPTAPAHGRLVQGGTSARYGLAAPAALPATSTDPALVAAGFLQRQLAEGGRHHLTSSFGGTAYPDYGLTIDAVLALDAAGAGQSEAAAATAYLAANVRSYIGDGTPTSTEIYAGATAKSLVLATAQGVDPRSFGGVDLVGTLLSLEVAGRYTDQSAWGDYSNMIGQSLAVVGLTRAGIGASPAAVSLVRSRQCADGGFALALAAGACTSDPDATAYAVQALVASAGAVDADAQQGLDYLAGVQRADGGVGGAGPTATANANSTGLAAQAFAAGGRTAQARSAQGFLRALQFDCRYAAAFRGGVAYDQAARTDRLTAGSTVKDQDRRSTTQALLGLAGTPLHLVSATGADAGAPTLSCVAAPTGSTTTTRPPSSTTTTGSLPSGRPSTPPRSATPDDLAFTGTDAAGTALLALGLLLVGAAFLVVARRRGTHT